MSKVQTLVEKGMQARREGRPDRARAYFGNALELARRSGDRGELIEGLKGMAQINRDDGRRQEAIPYLEEATALCREHEDGLLLAHTIRHLADVHQDEGAFEVAEPLYAEALALYRAGKPGVLDLANAVRPMGFLKEQMGRRVEAAAHFTEAVALYEQAHIPEGVAECRGRLDQLKAQ